MNIKLLRRIKKRILDRPRQFQMDCVVSDHLDNDAPFANEPVSQCGTACCIAGWAYCLTKRLRPAQVSGKVGFSTMINVAMTVLELSDNAALSLLNRHLWPEKFRKFRETPEVDAKNAARRIEYFIKYRE